MTPKQSTRATSLVDALVARSPAVDIKNPAMTKVFQELRMELPARARVPLTGSETWGSFPLTALGLGDCISEPVWRDVKVDVSYSDSN